MSRACDIMREVLDSLYKEQKDSKAGPLHIRAMPAEAGPQQSAFDTSDENNLFDCGVYACMNALSLVQGVYPQYDLGSDTEISRLRLEINRILLHLPAVGPNGVESVASLSGYSDDVDVKIILGALDSLLRLPRRGRMGV